MASNGPMTQFVVLAFDQGTTVEGSPAFVSGVVYFPNGQLPAVSMFTLIAGLKNTPGLNVDPDMSLILPQQRTVISVAQTDATVNLAPEHGLLYLASSWSTATILTKTATAVSQMTNVPYFPDWDNAATLVALTTPVASLTPEAAVVYSTSGDPINDGAVVWGVWDAIVSPTPFDVGHVVTVGDTNYTVPSLGVMPLSTQIEGYDGWGSGQVFQVVNAVMSFTITFITADIAGAGTNANISLTLYGSASQNGPGVFATYTIPTGQVNHLIRGNAFEQGEVNVVEITFNPFLAAQTAPAVVWSFGTISAIDVTSDGAGIASDWCPASIAITQHAPYFNEQTVTFAIDQWISEGTFHFSNGTVSGGNPG